jgi:hypothetical protein
MLLLSEEAITIYHTRSEHANHYMTGIVTKIKTNNTTYIVLSVERFFYSYCSTMFVLFIRIAIPCLYYYLCTMFVLLFVYSKQIQLQRHLFGWQLQWVWESLLCLLRICNIQCHWRCPCLFYVLRSLLIDIVSKTAILLSYCWNKQKTGVGEF